MMSQKKRSVQKQSLPRQSLIGTLRVTNWEMKMISATRTVTTCKQIFLSGLVGCLASLGGSLPGSTQAGELVIVKVDPEKKQLETSISFMEYFSAPGEFYPGMPWISKQKEGPFAKRTMWMIDGRPVAWDVGAAALKPGSRIYHYGSRHTTEFINIYSHEPVTIGALQWERDEEIELYRLMLRRYDTDAAVYQRFRRTIAEDAIFMDNGTASTREAVLVPGKMIRFLPAQQQIISGFTADALRTPEQLDENHHGMRAGTALGGKEVTDPKSGKSMPGCRLRLADGSEIDYGFDRKGYAVLDGNFIFSRTPLLHAGQPIAMGTYRGWTKAKYILARSRAMNTVDGVITTVHDDQFIINPDGGGDPVSITLADNARFQLDGQPSQAEQVIEVGRAVTIFNERKQIIEAINAYQPTPGFTKARSDPGDRGYAIIEYDHEGNRRVLQDGYNPFFDDVKTKERKPPASAGPTGWTTISREEAMQVHPEAADILATTILKPVE